MDQTLVEFVKTLRTAEIKVSPAETLDAMACLDRVGYDDREFLKNSLALVLSKTPEEKEAFDTCFENFFNFDHFEDSDFLRHDDDENAGEGDGDSNFEASGNSGEASSGGGQGASGATPEDLPELKLKPESELGRMLMSGDRNRLTVALVEAGREVGVTDIVVFTQKGLYTRKIMDAMGGKALGEEITELQGHGGIQQKMLSGALKKHRDRLRDRIRDYVEKQFFLHADESGKQLREELLKKVKLSNIEKRNFKDVQEVVIKMAKKLISIHSKRRKTFKRGQLDIRKTLRKNMQYDGMFFDIKWKAQKVDRPKVMAICDVSGSVSNYSRFLLMFLFSLAEILPKIRSFAFSSDLGEVTDLFEHSTLEDAMAKTMRDFGNGSTDYGQMLADFKSHCMKDVNNKTTIIILGDARNNYGDPKNEVLREIYDKCQRVIWLNPEPKMSWSVGDSEMKKYAAACHQVEVCNSLVHLERVVGNLLRNVS